MITRALVSLAIICTQVSNLSAEEGHAVTNSVWSVPVMGLSARIEVCSRGEADPLHHVVKLEIRNVTNAEVRVVAPPVARLTVEGLRGVSPESEDFDGGGLSPQFKPFTIAPGTTKTIPAFRPIVSTPTRDQPSKGPLLLKPGEYLLKGCLCVPIKLAGTEEVNVPLEPCKIIVTGDKLFYLDVYDEAY